MKRTAWLLFCAALMCAPNVGCTGKSSSTPTDASASASPASSPSTPASSSGGPGANIAAAVTSATKPPISNSNGDSEEESAPSKPASSGPSRPSFGSMSGGTSAPPSQPPTTAPAAPARPGLGATAGAAATAAGAGSGPARPGLGNSTGAAAPANPPAGSLAGASSAPSTPTNNNPFEDPAFEVPPTLELSLLDRAINAFKAGNTPRAYGLYHAHLLSVPPDEREGAMDNYRWDKKGVSPRLGYSFAVGLIVNNSAKVEDLKPIGTSLEALRGGAAPGGTGRGAGGFGGPGGGAAAAGVPSLPARDLSNAAGKFATRFVEEFAKSHSDGKWSEAFRSYEYGAPLTNPATTGGFASGLAGAMGGRSGPPAGPAGGAGGPPPGYGGQGGPPAGYAGGGSGAPPGYGSGQGGPPAGYAGGGGGAPPGYGSGQGGPPAGYRGGAGAGAPPGYGGQGGPPAGYSGGSNAGAPPGYGGGGAPPAGTQPPAGQGGTGNSGSSATEKVDYVAPQDDEASPTRPGAGFGRPGFGSTGNAPGAAAPGASAPGAFAPGGAPGFASPPVAGNPAYAKDIELHSGTIPLGPGLNFIGKGESIGELSKRAIEQHYDALIVFEVDVALVRANGTIKNDCRIKAIRLHAEKDAKEKTITSTLLNNREVAAEKDSDAKIDHAVEGFIKKLSEAYPMDQLPAFKSESIQGKRLKDLVNDKTRGKLDLLAEVELFASKGLIDETLKVAAFERIAGSDGKALVSSEPEDRVPILEKMIRREYD